MTKSTPAMPFFALAALFPLGLIMAGALWGGVWVWAALIWLTVLAALMDQLVAHIAPYAPDGQEFPAADALLIGIGAGHLVALPLVVLAIVEGDGLAEGAALFAAAGLWFGQVANPAAHELIHRPRRGLFWLGAAVYATLLFGHHASAHRLVHHRFAASRDDPNTARWGESYYRFAIRAWAGSWRDGWKAEQARRKPGALHPYGAYGIISGLTLMAIIGLAGWVGVAVWVGLALHAQAQLLLADYVQHYGLMRMQRPDGSLEPVGDAHSWNAPHWFSSATMLNAPRHSDHHAHPARPYPALRLPEADIAPRLPYALPVSCTLALSPGLWRRVMHPRLAAWQGRFTAA